MVTKNYNMNKGPPRLDLLFTVYLYITKVLTSQILIVTISINFCVLSYVMLKVVFLICSGHLTYSIMIYDNMIAGALPYYYYKCNFS